MDRDRPGRREYTPPTLIVYGDVVALTQNATGGKNDKGSGVEDHAHRVTSMHWRHRSTCTPPRSSHAVELTVQADAPQTRGWSDPMAERPWSSSGAAWASDGDRRQGRTGGRQVETAERG